MREESKKEIRFNFNNAINEYTEDSYLRELLLEFINYRESKNKPLNQLEFKKILSNLDLVGFNVEKKYNLLNSCIAGGYLSPICDWKVAVRQKEVIDDFINQIE